jgi:hypothetical protein
MNRCLLAGMAILLMTSVHGDPQAPARAAKPRTPVKTWAPSRTPDGQVDLQGIWSNATLTPLQRPAELAGKEFFTEAEAAEFEKTRIRQNDQDRPESRRTGEVGAYNQAGWTGAIMW